MMYRIVPPSEAHYVVSPTKTMVCSPDEKVREVEGAKGARWYFHIPIIRTIRKMDITTKELVQSQETYEKNQARYNVKTSVKYRIRDVKVAVEKISSTEELREQLKEIVLAGVRAVTVRYDVTEARANKKKMDDEIKLEIADDFAQWGLELVNFQLIDFQDTEDSAIISDISKRREVEIETRTRQENAEKFKEARLKEAQAEETAKTKEIEKDKIIAQKEQDKNREVAEREKEAQREKFEVVRVQTIKQAEIDKDKAIVEASQQKETEKIFMEQKQLEGQGDKLRDTEKAKGEAAPIREKGFAEAEAKEKLQAALNKFKSEAIRALVAEQIVSMQKEVGLKTAESLKEADLKVFAGGDSAKQGFDLGALISATSTGNEGTANAVLNKIARPNDLGLSDLDLQKVMNGVKKKPTPSSKTK
jgi:flotillin